MAQLLTKHRLVVVATIVTFSSTVASVAYAETKDGDPCTTKDKIINVTTKTSRTDFICKAEGNRKVWRVLKSSDFGSNSGKKSNSSGQSGSTRTTITIDKGPVLSVPPFKAGALDCTDQGPSPIPNSCFRPYGFSFTKGSGESKTLPSYQYILQPNTEIVAATDADLVFVEAQPETNDFEVLLIVFTNDKNAIWKIAYDHVDEVVVKPGSRVKAGQKIGVKKTNSDFELQVNQVRDQRGSKGNFYVCPKSLGSATFNKFHDDALQQSNAAFPKFAVTSQCLKPSIAESEYQG